MSNRRQDGRKGGGVALFINHKLIFSVKGIVSVTFESVFIEICNQKSKRKTIMGQYIARQILITPFPYLIIWLKI